MSETIVFIRPFYLWQASKVAGSTLLALFKIQLLQIAGHSLSLSLLKDSLHPLNIGSSGYDECALDLYSK